MNWIPKKGLFREKFYFLISLFVSIHLSRLPLGTHIEFSPFASTPPSADIYVHTISRKGLYNGFVLKVTSALAFVFLPHFSSVTSSCLFKSGIFYSIGFPFFQVKLQVLSRKKTGSRVFFLCVVHPTSETTFPSFPNEWLSVLWRCSATFYRINVNFSGDEYFQITSTLCGRQLFYNELMMMVIEILFSNRFWKFSHANFYGRVICIKSY